VQETKGQEMTILRDIRDYGKDEEQFSKVIHNGDPLSIHLVAAYSHKSKLWSIGKHEVVAYTKHKFDNDRSVMTIHSDATSFEPRRVIEFPKSCVFASKKLIDQSTTLSINGAVFDLDKLYKRHDLAKALIQLIGTVVANPHPLASPLTQAFTSCTESVSNLITDVKGEDHIVTISAGPFQFKPREESQETGETHVVDEAINESEKSQKKHEVVLNPQDTYLQAGYYIFFRTPVEKELLNRLTVSFNGSTPAFTVMRENSLPDGIEDELATEKFRRTNSYAVLQVRRAYLREPDYLDEKLQEYENLIRQLVDITDKEKALEHAIQLRHVIMSLRQ